MERIKNLSAKWELNNLSSISKAKTTW